MAFSVFSKPMGAGRLGSYIGGGAAVGAGFGAMMAGRDNRTSGAVTGTAIGAGAGIAIGAAHTLQGTGAWGAVKPWGGATYDAIKDSKGLMSKGRAAVNGARGAFEHGSNAVMRAGWTGMNAEGNVLRNAEVGVARARAAGSELGGAAKRIANIVRGIE